MSTIIALSVSGPVVGWAMFELLRTKRPTLRRNCDGVALQTVIVIVVLLAIAGAVAGVLLSRGREAVAEAERQDIVRAASEFTQEGLCESYGFTWTSGSCYRTVPVRQAASTFTTKSTCEDYTYQGNKPYTWHNNGTVVNTADDYCTA